MASYSTSNIKNGLKVLISNDPFEIIDNSFHKPGKGQAFSKVKLKNLSVERAKRIMDVRKPNECQPRTLQRFFEENFGNDLVDELLEKVKV